MCINTLRLINNAIIIIINKYFLWFGGILLKYGVLFHYKDYGLFNLCGL